MRKDRLVSTSAELVYVSDLSKGIRRIRRGKGFSYRHPDGSVVVDDMTLSRIRALAIPPAYTDVWICPNACGHIQATGRDHRKRKQYRYHKDWHGEQDASKFNRLVEFALALPALRSKVRADMALKGIPRERVLATVVDLLDRTLIRVGNAEYARDNGSFGLTTLQSGHVRVRGAELHFRFTGKSGKVWQLKLEDRRIANIVRAIQDLPGQDLFQYRDEDGVVRDVDSTAVNTYIRDVAGARYSAKDFRTWSATVLAAKLLSDIQPPTSKRDAASKLRAAIAVVAGRLGNTVAVCRASYIHPAVIDGFLAGRPCQIGPGECHTDGLSIEEGSVVRYLQALGLNC